MNIDIPKAKFPLKWIETGAMIGIGQVQDADGNVLAYEVNREDVPYLVDIPNIYKDLKDALNTALGLLPTEEDARNGTSIMAGNFMAGKIKVLNELFTRTQSISLNL